MSNAIKPEDIGGAISRELTLYSGYVNKQIQRAAAESMDKLVKLTKATAPVGKRGSFKRKITSTAVSEGFYTYAFVWHVKAPDHRLTHLLVHGHATKDGGRTKGNPFLANALAQVLPEYERKVEEVLQNDK
ncbi:MAG: hypothetical protein IKZ08_02890 [Bacteroidales bacterium]|nr:hypothetical protein [Bacteroidales bacterium]